MPNANVDFSRHQSHFPAVVVYQHNLCRVAKKAFAEKDITAVLTSHMIIRTRLEKSLFLHLESTNMDVHRLVSHIACKWVRVSL